MKLIQELLSIYDKNGEDRCYGVFDKDEGEVLSENKFGYGTNISDYNKYAEWIEMAHAKLFDKFGEDEDKLMAFEKAMADETSDDQMQVFMNQPSADSLHYNSNGRPDHGKTLEFLENFEDFKRSFKRIFDRFLHEGGEDKAMASHIKAEYEPVLKAHGFKKQPSGKYYKTMGCGEITITKRGHWEHLHVDDTDNDKDYEGTTARTLDRHLTSLGM
jgi:hypothetical protein